MNNENLNNNNDTKTEIIDASLLNPFQSLADNNAQKTNNVVDSINNQQDVSPIQTTIMGLNNQPVSEQNDVNEFQPIHKSSSPDFSGQMVSAQGSINESSPVQEMSTPIPNNQVNNVFQINTNQQNNNQNNAFQPNNNQVNNNQNNNFQPSNNQQNIIFEPINNQPNNNFQSNNNQMNNIQNNNFRSNNMNNNATGEPLVNQNFYANNNMNINDIEVDDELLSAYIGPNASKIMNQGISWPTFWLGILYTLYRKMWFLSFILFVISLVAAIFLPSLSKVITLGLGIFIFALFNKIYVNHAREDIKKIIIQNPNASRSDLIRKCQAKGGTSIAAPIVYILIYTGLQIYVDTKEREKISSKWDSYYNTSYYNTGDKR